MINKQNKKSIYMAEYIKIIKKIKEHKNKRINIQIDLEENFQKILKRLDNTKKTSKISFSLKIALITGVFLLMIGLSYLLSIKGMKKNKNNINELRTEFVISECNIKIFWVQKKDFDLNKLKSND